MTPQKLLASGLDIKERELNGRARRGSQGSAATRPTITFSKPRHVCGPRRACAGSWIPCRSHTTRGGSGFDLLPRPFCTFYVLSPYGLGSPLCLASPCRGVDLILPGSRCRGPRRAAGDGGSRAGARALAHGPDRLGSLAVRPTWRAGFPSARSAGAAAPCAPGPSRGCWWRSAGPASRPSRPRTSAPSSRTGRSSLPSLRAWRSSTASLDAPSSLSWPRPR